MLIGSRTEGRTESYTERWREAARAEATVSDVNLHDVGWLHKAYLNTLSKDTLRESTEFTYVSALSKY